MKCEEIRNIEEQRIHAENYIDKEDFEQAISLLSQCIEVIGDQYISESVLDSTGTKLVLANAEEKKGNLQLAANLKNNILKTRIELAKQKFQCN